jgi:hypothetical protein
LSLSSRFEQIEAVMADPPRVHDDRAPGGVWHTEPGAYRFIAEQCSPGERTLETGLGISTVLFALWKTEHTCVVPDQEEVDRLSAYAKSRSIDLSNVHFAMGPSDAVLPALEGPELDLVLVDGGHAFPLPIIDWYYAGGRLRAGGHVILDDMQLAQVSLGLRQFLDSDPRWTAVASTRKWVAYRRETDHPLDEGWWAQDFIAAKL